MTRKRYSPFHDFTALLSTNPFGRPEMFKRSKKKDTDLMEAHEAFLVRFLCYTHTENKKY
jgi:hypothetical protein